MQEFDTLIVITAKDYDRVHRNYPRLIKHLPTRNIIFIGGDEVNERLLKDNLGDKVKFLDENKLLPFIEIDSIMRDILKVGEVPRAMSGWYYQQFLKMKYSEVCEDEYYMVWDGDTIPCKDFSMFSENGVPYFDLKQEYCENYFITLSGLFPGMKKCIPKSFLSEHMLFKEKVITEIIDGIEGNASLEGSTFYEKILRLIGIERMKFSSFSEFETYGTYTCMRHLGSYMMRNWHSFRYCGNFFDPETINDEDYEWLSHDFEAVSFEKRFTRTEQSMEIFSKKEYREKLSARQILEIVQEESEGYKEEW